MMDKEVMTLQSDKLRPPKTHPLHPKSLQSAPQAPPTSQRTGRRRYSVGVGFKGLAKRRKRAYSEGQSEPVLPNNFLLGGNIFDPLNLNSLLEEEVDRSTNQESPTCSPLPSRGGDPVEILVPRDLRAPLNQAGGGATPPLPLRSRRRGRPRPHITPTVPGATPSPLPCELNTSINCRDDEVPPPLLPRSPAYPLLSRRRRHRRRSQPITFQTPLVGGAKHSRCAAPQKKRQSCRYYGYQGSYGDQWEGRVGAGADPRLRLLQPDWFRERRVLDIGCGCGHVTLAIARHFGPTHILGLDRDQRLVDAATLNVRHFLSHDLVLAERRQRHAGKEEEPFPLSFRVSRGPLAAPPLPPLPLVAAPLQTRPPEAPPIQPLPSAFPSNITFITGDYVSLEEAWPGRGLYDVIVCLGVTKCVQLQSGDKGVELLFRRAYQSLSPGGLFILETQPWRRRSSETTNHSSRSLRLRPEDYSGHLTQTTGFTSYQLLTHSGVQRPVYVFHKGASHRK